MGTGAITEYMDLAQLALYVFWIFFFSLVIYLHREGKREGWPLQMSSGDLRTGMGGMPKPKTYRLAHGQGERHRPTIHPHRPRMKSRSAAKNEPKSAFAQDF